jgi:uncharacterized membrane protein YfcA
MYSYYGNAEWSTIMRLLPPTVLGSAVGMQLLGTISKQSAKVLVGAILLGILALNLYQHLCEKAPAREAAAKGSDGERKKPTSKANQKKKKKKKKPTSKANQKKPQIPADRVPAYAHSVWFAWLVGLTGGFATILVNSMGVRDAMPLGLCGLTVPHGILCRLGAAQARC